MHGFPCVSLGENIDNNYVHCENMAEFLAVLNLLQRYTNSGSEAAVSAKFWAVALHICGSSVVTVLHVTLLARRILRWLLHFWKICALLIFFLGGGVLNLIMKNFSRRLLTGNEAASQNSLS
jgi:hypothetical protein